MTIVGLSTPLQQGVRWPLITTLAALLALAPAPSAAQDLRDLCPTRPGLGTAPCIIDAGRAIVEVGLVDWSIETSGGNRTDTFVLGDVIVRYGITAHSEVQVGWTSRGFVRQRARSSGAASTEAGSGDATIAFKHSFANPDGARFSLAVQPFVTLPVGTSPLGSGDWSVGLLLPMSFDVSDSVQLQLSPEVAAATDEDGKGRHLALSNVFGIGIALSNAVSAGLEVLMLHDWEEGSDAVVGTSLAWQLRDSLQLDLGANTGVHGRAPNQQFYIGVSQRF